MIPEAKINEVLEKADIVSVISKYAQLEKRGKEYLTLCLFHNDSSPSMHVSLDKKIFKCFSCGAGGNVISFIQRYKNVSFVQAVVELAKEYNVDLGNISLKKEPEKYNENEKKIFKINSETMKYYQALLNSKTGLEAKKYLENRNMSKEDILRWNIGYAYGNDSLIKHLINKGYKDKDLVDAGVATLTESGIHDYYVNRIIFPIKNVDGYVTGFSGRVLTDEKPKYVNTRETLVFKKSNILFNIDEVWKNKERYPFILVLEGFMDVISLNKVDIFQAIALMGTSLSKYHIEVLRNLKKPIKLFLDGDEPGINAMYKNSPKLIQNKIPFTIVDNTTINDPDELVNDNKTFELKKMIDNSMNPYDYFLKKWTKDKELNVDQKVEVANKIFNLLQYEPDILIKDAILNDLASRLGLTREVLEQEFKKFGHSAKKENFVVLKEQNKTTIINNQRIVNNVVKKTKQSKKNNNQKEIMNARVFLSLVNSGDYISQIEDNLSTIYPSDYLWQTIISKIISYYKSGLYDGNDSSKLAELLKHESNQQLKTQGNNFSQLLAREKALTNNDNLLNKKEMDDIIIQGKINSLNQENKEAMQQVEKIQIELENSNDEEKCGLLKAQIRKLQHANIARTKRVKELSDSRKKDQ